MRSLCRKSSGLGTRDSGLEGARLRVPNYEFRVPVLILTAMALFSAAPSIGAPDRVLRVCSDPNNLPFSNRRLEGFENRIAALLAREMNAKVEYTWWAQRRGFLRNTLKAGACDVVLGLPSGIEMAQTSHPYYRSSYVFVTRSAERLDLRSFDDPRLKKLKIGVQLIGDDYANTPPAHELARRGLVRNIVGFTVYGDYGRENPPARIIEAVARGQVDAAIVWGPLAGYFAPRQDVRLSVTPVSPSAPSAEGSLPMSFDIAVGVRRGDTALAAEIDSILQRRRADVNRILDFYGVPRPPSAAAHAEPGSPTLLEGELEP